MRVCCFCVAVSREVSISGSGYSRCSGELPANHLFDCPPAPGGRRSPLIIPRAAQRPGIPGSARRVRVAMRGMRRITATRTEGWTVRPRNGHHIAQPALTRYFFKYSLPKSKCCDQCLWLLMVVQVHSSKLLSVLPG